METITRRASVEAMKELYEQWLGAMGRCFSLITGLGKRTRSRQENTNQYKRDAYERLQEWQERIIKRANSQHGQTGWEEIVRLEELLEDMERLHEAMKAANKATRSSKLSNAEKDDALVALGFSESRATRLRLEQELHGSAFPPHVFTKDNARIKAIKGCMARLMRAQKAGDMGNLPVMANAQDDSFYTLMCYGYVLA